MNSPREASHTHDMRSPNKMKIPFIKFILTLLFVLAFNSTSLATENQFFVDGYSIKKTTSRTDNISVSQTDTYEVISKDCIVSWDVSVPTEEMRKYANLTIYPTYPHDRNCALSFKKQLPINRAIFKAIFKDRNKKDFTGLHTFSFRVLDSSRNWSMKIALASIKSEDYIDYRKNYPNHKSGKHINEIFVDISNSNMVYENLESLLREHNLSIMLTGVEKVFSDKVMNIQSYDKQLYNLLIKQGVNEKQRVLYDAGSFYFNVKTKELR